MIQRHHKNMPENTMMQALTQLNRGTVIEGNGFVAFDNRITIDKIANFNKLPEVIQKMLLQANELRFVGWQELIGYGGEHNRTAIWSASYHEVEYQEASYSRPHGTGMFVIESVGGDYEGKCWQWSQHKGPWIYEKQ